MLSRPCVAVLVNDCCLFPVNSHACPPWTSFRPGRRSDFFFFWTWIPAQFWQTGIFLCSLHVPSQESWLWSLVQGLDRAKWSDPGLTAMWPGSLCHVAWVSVCSWPWLLWSLSFCQGVFSPFLKNSQTSIAITVGTRCYSHVSTQFKICHWALIILRTKSDLLIILTKTFMTCLLLISLASSITMTTSFYCPDIVNYLYFSGCLGCVLLASSVHSCWNASLPSLYLASCCSLFTIISQTFRCPQTPCS